MTASELKSVRLSMNLDIKHMALTLGWPYRTYQDRELGNRGIPKKAKTEVLQAKEHNDRTMSRIRNLIASDIDGKLIK